MKKALFALALMGAFSAALAGNNNGPDYGDVTNNYDNRNYGGNTTNQGGAGGLGGQGGQGFGGDATSIAGASSVAEAKANAAAIAAQQQAQQQGQAQGQIANSEVKNSGNSSSGSAVVGSGNSRNNNRSSATGNTTRVNVGGDTYERSAPPVVAGNIPAVPTSCRIYLFGGATNTSGAVSGSVPLGNDQTCLSIATVNLMERVGGYTQAEKQAVVCRVEGMAELETCKNLK